MKAISRRTALLAMMVAWCSVLLALRVWYSGEPRYSFLAWNMALAIVPAAAAAFLRLSASRASAPLRIAAFCVWLSFLPNAPYLVTDFIHLRLLPPVPLWFDVALFGSYSAVGVLLGYTAVADVQLAVSRWWGRPAGSLVAFGSLLLSGFGIYIGRFLRWNSWDLLSSPLVVVRQVAARFSDPLSHPRTWAVSIICGLALVLGYAAFREIAKTLHEPDPETAA